VPNLQDQQRPLPTYDRLHNDAANVGQDFKIVRTDTQRGAKSNHRDREEGFQK